MTENERKSMMILADTIKGEINRMCVTKEFSELDTMACHATKNIIRLRDMRYSDFKADKSAIEDAIIEEAEEYEADLDN